MEIKKSLFSGGELDPALHDNVDTQAWRLGLAKARNVHAGRNGRVVNDAGTYFLKSYDSAVKVCPVEGDNYVLIFYHDGVNGKVQAVGLDSYMYYSFLSEEKIFLDGVMNTGFTQDDIPRLKYKTIKHNDGDRWLYVAAPNGGVQRYTLSGGIILSETVTFEADVPDIEGVTLTVANFADLAALTPLSLFEGNSAYVLTDATVGLRGWYKYIGGVWVQQTVNSIGSLTAGGYGNTKAGWDAFTGASVQYGITLVTDKGEESQILIINTYRPLGSTNTAEYTFYSKLPSTSAAISSLSYTFNNVYFLNGDYSGKINRARVYRRPVTPSGTFGQTAVAGAWGYVGDGMLSLNVPNNNTSFDVTYTEYNVQADYTNQPPYISQDLLEFMVSVIPAHTHQIKAFGVSKYDSRLVYYINDKVLFSRLGSPNNFLRDFPSDGNNSFMLEIGTGDTTVYGVEEKNGLIVFTDKGVKVGANPVTSQADPRVVHAGDWIIDQDVGSLATPFGVLFFDSSTNTIRRLGYSTEEKEFSGQDIGALAGHLFYNKKVVSWALKAGDDSTVVIILDDGSAVNISYDDRTKVFGFFPKDTADGIYKQVTPYKDTSDNQTCLIYVIERDGINYIEIEAQRRAKKSQAVFIPQTVNFAHSTKVHSNPAPYFTGELKRNNVEDWGSELVIESVATEDELDSYFKCFNFVTGESCLMKYTSRDINDYPVFTVVENSLPESLQGVSTALFKCTTIVEGLEHLEGKEVSVIADNSLESSPYNEDYPTLQVVDGKIMLEKLSAFVLVGLPYISDIVTLQIDTDANNTTLLKPKIVNNLIVKYDQTRGGYVGGELPEDNSISGMDRAEVWNSNSQVNMSSLPQTARKSYNITSTWKTNGSIAFRQVDPLPLEVMSVILDVAGG